MTPSYPKEGLSSQRCWIPQVWDKGHFKSSSTPKKGKRAWENWRSHKKTNLWSPWGEDISSSRTLGTRVVCNSISANSILQPISSEWNSWSCIPPYADSTGQVSTDRKKTGISSHCGWQHNLMHGLTSMTVWLTQEQGATSCPCTSTGCCLETRSQSLPQSSSMDMVTPQ